MHAIVSLRPNVTRDEAILCLRGRGLVRALRRAALGPLRSIADVYVPFRVFRVSIQNGVSRQVKLMAIDAVCGTFDLYSFDSVPGEAELIRIVTANHPGTVLDEAQARGALLDHLRRLMFRQGFFRIRDLRLAAEPLSIDLHVPYWIGFSGFGNRVNLNVMDAVRRRLEGGKVRQFFCEWLSSQPAERNRASG